MFINASLPGYAVAIIIAVIALQYAFALFCLLKLAYLDMSKKQYALWNLFILLAVFVGGAVFLVMYRMGKFVKIPPYDPSATETESAQNGEEQVADESTDKTEEQTADEPTDKTDKSEEQTADGE